MSREIGRIIVRWAYFEHYVQATIWAALELDGRLGRLAVREPRITDRLDLLRDIGEVRGVPLPLASFKDLRKQAERLLAQRDILAHAIWHNTGQEWVAQLARGTWGEPEAKSAGFPKSRKIMPESIPFTVPGLRTLVKEIEQLPPSFDALIEEANRHAAEKRATSR